MKRTLLLFTILAMLFGMTACTIPGITKPTEAPTTPPEEQPTIPEVLPAAQTKVPNAYTMAELNSLPTAKPGMTEEELRQIVLAYMRAQCHIIWTPSIDFEYDSQSTHRSLFEGTLYGGMPYITNCQSSLYNFMHFYDERNGMLDMERLMSSKQPWQKILANQCSGSTYWAWARVSNSIKYGYCTYITPANGFVFAEGLELPVLFSKFYDNDPERCIDSFDDIAKPTGQQNMYQIYANMKPADGLVYFDSWYEEKVDGEVVRKNRQWGHVIMCADVYVEYNDDGTIDGKKSYALILDQTLGFTQTLLENGETANVYPNWEKPFTFDYLYRYGYLPFTLPEFAGTDPVEEATVTAQIGRKPIEGESITMTEFYKMKLVANYPISYYTVILKNSTGGVLYSEHIYTLEMNAYDILSVLDTSILDQDRITELANDGRYTLEITARVSTGEVITAYSGGLTN